MTSPISPLEMSASKGIVGLTNIGNTCYGNATLQALRHQVEFTIYLLQGQHTELLKRKPQTDRSKLMLGYGELVRSLWTSENGHVNTREFWALIIPAAIKSGFEQFRTPIPHDAHEFLVFLLDEFHEALKEEVQMTIKPSVSPDVSGALSFWKTSFEKSYSPLVELLFGLHRKSIRCDGCGKESVSWETLNILKVSVPAAPGAAAPPTLLDLVKAEEGGEEIDGYHCEACPQRTHAKISRALWRLGNWMIIVLKRNDNRGRRINTPVDIPLTLSLGDAFHPASQEPSRVDPYELFATIHHHGSANGGHYTAHAKHPVSGRWAHYDDESAREMAEPSLDASTYIVMYKRVVPEKAPEA